MRIFSLVTAVLVVAVIYVFVFQRNLILNFGKADALAGSVSTPQAPTSQITDTPSVSVVVLASRAQNVASAVNVRGETRAARQVNLRAETNGSVISQPLRKGSFVTAGQPMCEIDPGTRGASLAETKARLAESRARAPEAEARVIEAQARLAEALINDRAAAKLSQG